MAGTLTIAIIGAGSAGREFARVCASAGFRVVLEDVMPAKLRDAEVAFLSLGHDVALVSTVEDAVRDADIAIDFVPDELESKLEIFSLIDRMAPPRTILCTPSETLSITDLASCTYRPARCVMLRSLASGPVRILYPRSAAPDALETITQLLRAIGRMISLQPDPDLPMLMKNMGYRPGQTGF
jgi:3-hydroxybutyryl-CoA dehydrogenase